MSYATQAAHDAVAAGQSPRAVAIANEAARTGDVEALALIAHWRLAGSALPRDLGEARRLLRQAADAGHTPSALVEIALIANGTGAAPDWGQALERLRHLANGGAQDAQAELALLTRMDIDPGGFPRSLPEAVSLGERGAVRRWPAMLSQDECAHIATRVLDLLEPSMIADPRTGRQVAHPIRRSSAAVIGPTRETLPIQAIQRRIAAATGTDVRQGEPLSVLHYAPGQEYRAHMDTLPLEPNQRIATALLYLNAGYAGGQTHFPALGVTVVGQLGDMIAFDNVRHDGLPDPASQHAGLPIQRGVKWMATRWIRARPLDVWNPDG